MSRRHTFVSTWLTGLAALAVVTGTMLAAEPAFAKSCSLKTYTGDNFGWVVCTPGGSDSSYQAVLKCIRWTNGKASTYVVYGNVVTHPIGRQPLLRLLHQVHGPGGHHRVPFRLTDAGSTGCGPAPSGRLRSEA